MEDITMSLNSKLQISKGQTSLTAKATESSVLKTKKLAMT